MFTFLEIRLKEKHITKRQLSKFLNVSYDTIINKFRGKTDWWRNECEQIKNEFFPEYSIDDLFKKD